MPVRDAHSFPITALSTKNKRLLECRNQSSRYFLDSLLLQRFGWLKSMGGQDEGLLREDFQGVKKHN